MRPGQVRACIASLLMVSFHICIGVLNECGILDTGGTTVSSNSSTFVYNDQVLLDLTESFHLAKLLIVSNFPTRKNKKS